MSSKLTIDNYLERNIKETSQLDADVPVNSSSLTLINNQNIAQDDYLLLGTPGSETSEIVKVSGVTGATVATTTPTALLHNQYDKVTVLYGNQINIYRAPNTNNLQPDDGSFSLLTTISIDPDQVTTIYNDNSGGSSYWYKASYINQTTSAETARSQNAMRGDDYGDYVSLEAIREEAGFKNNRNISEERIDRHRQAAQDYINGELSGMFTLPFQPPVNRGIARIAMMLAAGYLQIDLYGSAYNTDPSSGKNSKVSWAEAQLEKIKSGQIAVTDTAGQNTATPNTNGFSGYPNAETTLDTNYAEDFMFTRDSIHGYNERKY